jgi:hypothetical protein
MRSHDRRRLRSSAKAVAARRFAGIAARRASTATRARQSSTHTGIDKASFPVTVRSKPLRPRDILGGVLGVRLRLSDPEFADNLRDFLERRECAVVEIDAETLEVELPHELHAEQARLELDLYLRVWQSLHEWSAVEYVEEP